MHPTTLFFLLTSSAAMLYDVTQAHCFHGNAAKTCQFTCHCMNDAACDMTDGTCPGAAFDIDYCDTSPNSVKNQWTGTGCQIGGVAVGARVYSTYENDLAPFCVDDNSATSCFIGPRPGYEVVVDLEMDYVIHYVTPHRPSNRDMHITLIDSSGTDLVTHTTYSSNNVYFDNVIARRVKVTSVSTNAREQVYEVIVNGYQYVECVEQEGGQFYYGPGCLKSCGVGCAEQCDYITGSGCTTCHSGYQGQGCNVPCSPGYWGPGCTTECNCLDEEEVCHAMTGACTMCAMWYTDTGCDHALPRMADLPKPVAEIVDSMNVTVTFTQLTLEADDVTSVTYRLRYYPDDDEDDAVTLEDIVIAHDPEATDNMNLAVFELAEDEALTADIYYKFCIVPYDVAFEEYGEASDCDGEFFSSG